MILPTALGAMASYAQFILYKIVVVPGSKAKKLPVDHRTMQVFEAGINWQQDPSAWTTHEAASAIAAMCGDDYGVGFLFTANDPFFFVDLDKCLNTDGVTWSDVACDVMAMLPGCAMEVSHSKQGLHIFGTGIAPEHACKNIPLDLEFYTSSRFVALTGINAVGDVSVDCSAILPAIIDKYFPPRVTVRGEEWTTEPCDAWSGPTDDDELLAKALNAGASAGSVFGGKSTLSALWTGDENALAESYPDDSGDRVFDASSADMALAQHLCFWTGNQCDRILRLMQRSGLVRDKWGRDDYLTRTILRASSLQDVFYSNAPVAANVQGVAIAEQFGAPKMRASSPAQLALADTVRAQKLADCVGDEATIKSLCSASGANVSAKFWLDNQDKTPEQLTAMLTSVETAAAPMGDVEQGPQVVSGYQHLGATLQIEHFDGCVYVQALHKVFTPSGTLLKADQFNATYGGYIFQLDETGDKTTRKAWEAFTESQVVRWPKAESVCFRPMSPTGELVEEEGRMLVNTYVPVSTPNIEGDVTPFLDHLNLLLPIESDRVILLAYLAACVQHIGVKFQWAPVIQGAPGNGKTLLTRCVAAAVGKKYTHWPKASNIDSNFNGWLDRKLLIGVEDIVVPNHRQEVIEALKPMITNDEIEVESKGVDQVTVDNYANFILNMNPKDGLRKDRDDRRFCVFYTAQQSAEDVARDGMGGNYFPNIYGWLKSGGYAAVTHWLTNYKIPDALNPAGACHRAPMTSSTDEAVEASMGGIEQEILEAIDEGRVGFAGGWVSSMAIERLLDKLRLQRAIPQNKRRDLMKTLGYDYHPTLKDGRANNHIATDGGKPKLYIKDGHIHCNLANGAEVARHYEQAQGSASIAAAAVFNN